MPDWRKPAALVGVLVVALVAVAALTGWRANQPGNAPRRTLVELIRPAAQFDTKANYATFWESAEVIRPVFRTGESINHEFECQLAEQSALAGEGWRADGRLTLNTHSNPRGMAYLRLQLNAQGSSRYSLGTDRSYAATPFKVGGIDQPVASGADDFICLYHAANGQPNSAGVMPLWYCALGFNFKTAELRLTETDGVADLSQGIVPVRVTSGRCRALGAPRNTFQSANRPPPDPSPPPVEAKPPPPPPPPPPPVEPVAERPYTGTISSICSTSGDGKQVWCGPDASICSSTLDGRRVACGGRATICTSSLNGKDVACGGEASICTSSLDGSDVACGGRASICTSSLNGNDVACGGEASICTTSLNGKDAACGARAGYCATSLSGARVCGNGTYTAD